MSHIILSLRPEGALVDVRFAVSEQRYDALIAAGATPPDPIETAGLIDTGASSTCIDARIIQTLGLTARGAVPMHTPSTKGKPVMADQYDVGFGLADQHGTYKIVGTLPVLASHFDGFGALIGRDILNQMLLIYDGIAGHFTLSF